MGLAVFDAFQEFIIQCNQQVDLNWPVVEPVKVIQAAPMIDEHYPGELIEFFH